MFGRMMIAATAAAMLTTAVPQQVQAQSVEDRCEDYAYRVAWRNGRNRVGEGALGGAVAGGVIGAILGKGKSKNIVGGAVAGTAAGALLGATNSDGGYVDRRAYRVAYRRCLDDNIRPVRAYRPARVYRDVDEDDVAYCSARFKSYNPNTGLYLTYGGRYKACP
jgi:uncharacterized protein YcfJ